MAVTTENIFYEFVLKPLTNDLRSEFPGQTIYIAPSILHQDPFSIRIWGGSAETHEYYSNAWQKQYNIEIALYEIEKNPGEAYYRQFYVDIERIYQHLFTNAKTRETTYSGVTHTWIDGVCDEFIINEFEEDEDDIDGLNVCRFIFNCKIMRED